MINSRVLTVSLMSKSTPGNGFSPGAGVLGAKSPPKFYDAADILVDSEDIQPASLAPGVLLLAD